MDEPASSAIPSKFFYSHHARYAFWTLFSISFLNYLDRFVLTGAANTMAKELGFSLDGIGYVTSAFLIVYTFTTIPLGVLADRGKRKNVVAFCVTVWSIATALTALATNFTTLFLARMLLGIGEAGYFPAGTALLSDYFSLTRRSRVMSLWSTAEVIGILGGFGIGGALAGLYIGSWRLAFLITGIPGLLLAYLAWRAREPARNQADMQALTPQLQPEEIVPPAATAPSIKVALAKVFVLFKEPVRIRKLVTAPFIHLFIYSGKASALFRQPIRTKDLIIVNFMQILTYLIAVSLQFRQLFRIRTLVVLIFMQIFAYFVLGVTVNFLPIYLQQIDTFGFTSRDAGIYSGVVVVVAGGVGTLLGGYMADILNRHHPGARVLICGIGFLLSAPALAVALLYHNLLIFTLFFIITALLLRLYSGPSSAATSDVVPAVLRASAVALTLLFAHLFGDAFAPAIVGVLATNFDPTHGQHFLHSVAGQDLSKAMLFTCIPALIISGLIGIFGARWMKSDIATAARADGLLTP